MYVCICPPFGGRATVFLAFMVMSTDDVGQLSLEERHTTTPRTAVPAVTSIIITMMMMLMMSSGVVGECLSTPTTLSAQNCPLRGPLRFRTATKLHGMQKNKEGRSPHGVY